MPSFDIVSEVNRMEVKNAIDLALRELATRFDFKGSPASIEYNQKEDSIQLKAQDASRLKSLREILINKLARRNVDLRNIQQLDPEISPLGHASQKIIVKQGLDPDSAKQITKAIKALNLKVQSTLQDRQIRVSGKKKDDLQTVIAALRSQDFGIALQFTNFRE
ncbi:MAG: YajQ family cyclic di-GMP-binding protein [Chthoniobacterales bacterium]|nr:YajQ family cyclic di-GMP-binding protein [Chthoniobacterales bacterium]MCX7713244.1 YajQ family cyclic di-GMP-binding protein [Chthoniobacterales bacterium]